MELRMFAARGYSCSRSSQARSVGHSTSRKIALLVACSIGMHSVELSMRIEGNPVLNGTQISPANRRPKKRNENSGKGRGMTKRRNHGWHGWSTYPLQIIRAHSYHPWAMPCFIPVAMHFAEVSNAAEPHLFSSLSECHSRRNGVEASRESTAGV